MGKSLSRRQFVAGAAILGGSLALTACGANPTPKQDSSDPGANSDSLQADIVVIGSGLAGLACAASAGQAGAKVLLIDKAPFLASSFSTSKGNVSIAQVPENKEYWQFESEVPDTMDDFTARFKKATEIGKIDAPYPDYKRMQQMMEESCKTVSWVEEMGIDFEKSFTKEQAVADTVKPAPGQDPSISAGQQIANVFEQELENRGVEIKLSTEAKELIYENDAVTGIVISEGGKKEEVRAKAVVLASGGFGASKEYCDELVPSINKVGFQYLGNGLNTGDGMTMSSALDAALYEDCWVIPFVIMPTKTLTEADSDFSKLCDFGMEGAFTSTKMLVNAKGERFVNEAGPVTALATSMTDLNAGPYYVLFDSSNPAVAAVIEKGLTTKEVFKAESIEELASAAGTLSLPATFETYQASATSGTDETFGKKQDSLIAYQTGPYYLVSYVPSYVTTLGGVMTNDDCQVIRKDETAIPGLYAIGELTHRFMYNRSFVRNCSNACALTMGRLTGDTLANV